MNSKDTAHIMMQSKGGVGKSIFSSILAQYLYEKNKSLRVISTGPVHHTLEKYKRLNVKRIETLNEDQRIDQSNFDCIFEDFIKDSFSMIVDTSSNDFLSFNHYMINDVVSSLISEFNKQYIIHCPIAYGQNMDETISCLLRIIEDYPDVPIIIWENEFFGKNQNSFIDASIFNNPNHIIGAVKLEYLYDDIEKEAFSKMLNKYMTFEEIHEHNDFNSVEKEILERIKRNIWRQLDFIFNKNIESIN